jgi:hypothetical protein
MWTLSAVMPVAPGCVDACAMLRTRSQQDRLEPLCGYRALCATWPFGRWRGCFGTLIVLIRMLIRVLLPSLIDSLLHPLLHPLIRGL